MTVYAVEWSGDYCGGVAIVNAKSKADARKRAEKSMRKGLTICSNAEISHVEQLKTRRKQIYRFDWAE